MGGASGRLLDIVGWGLRIDGLSALFKETLESFLPFPSNRDCRLQEGMMGIQKADPHLALSLFVLRCWSEYPAF